MPDSRSEDPDHGLDVDAAFAEIVAHWGEDSDTAVPGSLTADHDPDGVPHDAVDDGGDHGREAHDDGDDTRDGPDADAAEAARRDHPARGRPAGPVEPLREEDPEEPVTDRTAPRADPTAEDLRPLFQPAWSDPLDTEASWDSEGHFVPPPPPPLPPLEPRRKAAWGALVGSPVLALALLILGWPIPGLVAVLLVGGFVGGFVYLVATMTSGPRGNWPGDDGAVV